MNDDEYFASALRSSDNVFGELGESDELLEEIESSVISDSYTPRPHHAQNYPEPVSGVRSVGDIATVAMAPIQTQGGDSLGAAITLFMLIGGAAAGWHLGKAKGALGGALAGAGARNLYRAQKNFRSQDVTTRAEAVKPGLIGLIGLGAGAYLLYNASGK
jgi:hypothetical protein